MQNLAKRAVTLAKNGVYTILGKTLRVSPREIPKSRIKKELDSEPGHQTGDDLMVALANLRQVKRGLSDLPLEIAPVPWYNISMIYP